MSCPAPNQIKPLCMYKFLYRFSCFLLCEKRGQSLIKSYGKIQQIIALQGGRKEIIIQNTEIPMTYYELIDENEDAKNGSDDQKK